MQCWLQRAGRQQHGKQATQPPPVQCFNKAAKTTLPTCSTWLSHVFSRVLITTKYTTVAVLICSVVCVVSCCCAQTQVIIDPYAKAVLSRRRYGELGAPLDYEKDEVLGLAATWPQAAAFLPKPSVSSDHHTQPAASICYVIYHAIQARFNSALTHSVRAYVTFAPGHLSCFARIGLHCQTH